MAKAKATIKSVVVVLEHTPDAPTEYKWSVHCPAIPACFSEGRTREEALKNIREVLSAYWELVGEELQDHDIEVIEVAP
jgi:predicted RNase H-like HicB family nuclease